MVQEQQVDRKDLKIQALLEKVSTMTAQYENQVADLRVELTLVSQELNEARQAAAEAVEPEAVDEPEKKKK